MKPGRLAHGWSWVTEATWSSDLRTALRQAVRAIPAVIARRIGPCQIEITRLSPEIRSRWELGQDMTSISVQASLADPHEIVLEVLLCTGQILWERATEDEIRGYLLLLHAEIAQNLPGEIDEEVWEKKQALLTTRWRARSLRALLDYAKASFAATVAEYIHALWHDVTVRSGPEFLPPEAVRQRLLWMAQHYPPNPGYQLFAEE